MYTAIPPRYLELSTNDSNILKSLQCCLRQEVTAVRDGNMGTEHKCVCVCVCVCVGGGWVGGFTSATSPW